MTPATTPIGIHGLPRLHAEDDEPPDDGPTMASDIGAFAATSASGYVGKDLAPHAAPSPASRSPLASTRSQDANEENDAATVTVPKDVLDRVRANPKAVLEEEKRRAPIPAAGRPYRVHDDDDENAEPTKAVPRDQLLGRGAGGVGQDGHVVIGADAGGEDATLAVPPGANEASGMNLGAAIGESLGQGHPPHGPDGGFPAPAGHHPYQSVQGMQGQMMGQPQQSMGPMPPHMMGPGGPMGMSGQAGPWSSGQMQAAIPRTQGGAPSYGGGPMMQQQPPQHGIPRGQVPTNWNPVQAPRQKSKISGQMILLFVVGFVCLAIFVTGIVLFATTKF